MSLIGSFFGKDAPNDKYIDDQTVQEDHRDNKFVGAAIETASAVYDTMFRALKYVIRGKADVLGKMDKMVKDLEDQCAVISNKYREILGKLNDAGADFAAGLTIEIGKDAFDLLNSHPVLRRYIGEANYWVLWDTLATISSQGASIGGDLVSNLKSAIKPALYALISMTDGLMRYEAYVAQLTQFWGWLYAKEIRLPLTDSICPQVTCTYFYKPVDDGQLAGSDTTNKGPDKFNPVPGANAFAPMPIPIFDYEHNSPADIAAFRYDDPDTWRVLIDKSRSAFIAAYKYWRSNYTNATSVNELLSAASRKLTGGKFTAGFGPRKHNHPLGTPLRVGHTFAQLYSGLNESYPIEIMTDALASAYAAVDAAMINLEKDLGDEAVCARRDAAITQAFAEYGEDGSAYVGKWWANISGPQGASPDTIASSACYDVAYELESFKAFGGAVGKLASAYREAVDPSAPDYIPGYASSAVASPAIQYLTKFYSDIAAESNSGPLQAILKKGETSPEMYGPYSVFTETPLDNGSASFMLYMGAINAIDAGNGFFYSEAGTVLSSEIDVDSEIGRKIDGGRRPLFAAVGVYGNLIQMCPWDYKVVSYDSFKEKYTRIRGSYRIYYRNADPSKVIFADNIIRVGPLKYIVTCNAAAFETVSRGAESYTSYIFPSESCAVTIVPSAPQMFGAELPSFASLQRVDAVDPNTGVQYMYSLTTNVIPRWPRYVDPEKWSVMDLIHELWLLADSLASLCGDGGKRKAELSDLLNQFGLIADGPNNGPRFVGQLPENDGESIRIEFSAMNEFAGRLKSAIDSVYTLRDELLSATRNW